MKWKKDNKLPNTKNVRKKDANGQPINTKKPKRGSKKQQQPSQSSPSLQNDVSIFLFKMLFINLLDDTNLVIIGLKII